jgi:hypothetical protein
LPDRCEERSVPRPSDIRAPGRAPPPRRRNGRCRQRAPLRRRTRPRECYRGITIDRRRYVVPAAAAPLQRNNSSPCRNSTSFRASDRLWSACWSRASMLHQNIGRRGVQLGFYEMGLLHTASGHGESRGYESRDHGVRCTACRAREGVRQRTSRASGFWCPTILRYRTLASPCHPRNKVRVGLAPHRLRHRLILTRRGLQK